jgi:capsid portal protein
MDNYDAMLKDMTEKKRIINAQLDLMRDQAMAQWEQATAPFDIDARNWTKEQNEINSKWARLYDWL